MDMTGGVGVDAALECVGTGQSMNTAFGIARVGSIVGAVGVPHDSTVPLQTVIFRNVGLRGSINPGLVLDYETSLDDINDAYTAMLERRATKALVRISAGP